MAGYTSGSWQLAVRDWNPPERESSQSMDQHRDGLNN